MKTFILALVLAFIGCRAPDEISLSPWYGTGQSTWSNEGRDFSSHTSGLMGTATWSVGKRYEAYKNLAALDVSKAGQLTLRDDHHDVAPTPIIIPVAGKDPVDPVIPEDPPFWKQIRIPKTFNEALLLGMFAMILVGSIILLKRAGVKLPFLSSKKD